MWKASVYFPQCPENLKTDPLLEYYENLQLNKVFSYSDHSEFCPKLTLLTKDYLEGIPAILVLSKSDNEKLTIAGIQLDEKTGYFIHFNLGSFSHEAEAIDSMSVLKRKNDWWGASLSISYKSRY